MNAITVPGPRRADGLGPMESVAQDRQPDAGASPALLVRFPR
jgi:hypothetical protein